MPATLKLSALKSVFASVSKYVLATLGFSKALELSHRHWSEIQALSDLSVFGHSTEYKGDEFQMGYNEDRKIVGYHEFSQAEDAPTIGTCWCGRSIKDPVHIIPADVYPAAINDKIVVLEGNFWRRHKFDQDLSYVTPCCTRCPFGISSEVHNTEPASAGKAENQGECVRCLEGNCPVHRMGHSINLGPAEGKVAYDAVVPPHYNRGPKKLVDIGSQITTGRSKVEVDIACIDVMRHIQDPRLATAFKYLWRVAFGGKSEPWDSRSQEEVDARDIKSLIWYLEDYVANPVEPLANLAGPEYNALKERLEKAEKAYKAIQTAKVRVEEQAKGDG